MVLQVLANPRQVANHRNAQCSQPRSIANAGQFKQLRAVHGTGGEDDFAAGQRRSFTAAPAILDGSGVSAGKADTGDLGTGEDPQVATLAGRLQVAGGRRRTPAAVRGELVVADAFLLRAVEIDSTGNAQGFAGGDDRLHQLVLLADTRHLERSGVAVQWSATEIVALGADEAGQHLLPGPAGVAEC
ncbi:MAG: hypothetical protein AW12_02746 [Candidatus Accumulibacter sp. BA-94]|nr:MAG: hypothetical protein AW12_02746 [Candidatus Accumulibacter sp. BA-94]